MPKGFFAGDVGRIGVLELRLELLDGGVEGFFVKRVELFTSSMDEVV